MCCALDPSQAQDDPTIRRERLKLMHYLILCEVESSLGELSAQSKDSYRCNGPYLAGILYRARKTHVTDESCRS
jgi:hypothetical protein